MGEETEAQGKKAPPSRRPSPELVRAPALGAVGPEAGRLTLGVPVLSSHASTPKSLLLWNAQWWHLRETPGVSWEGRHWPRVTRGDGRAGAGSGTSGCPPCWHRARPGWAPHTHAGCSLTTAWQETAAPYLQLQKPRPCQGPSARPWPPETGDPDAATLTQAQLLALRRPFGSVNLFILSFTKSLGPIVHSMHFSGCWGKRAEQADEVHGLAEPTSAGGTLPGILHK